MSLKPKEATSEEALELVKIADTAFKDFRGDFSEFERAVGMLVVGRQVGWKVLVLIHDKKTLRKYEQILGINVRERFDEVGPLANKAVAWKLAQKVTNFWKAVSGAIPGIRSSEITK